MLHKYYKNSTHFAHFISCAWAKLEAKPKRIRKSEKDIFYLFFGKLKNLNKKKFGIIFFFKFQKTIFCEDEYFKASASEYEKNLIDNLGCKN